MVGLAVLLGAAQPVMAQQDEISPVGPEAGRALAAELRNLRLEESSTGVLKIRGHGRKMVEIPIRAQPMPGEAQWKMVYLAGTADNPAQGEQLTVVHAANGPNQYVYGAPGATKVLTGAQAQIPFAGSDFWLADLGFEFYHWPGQIRQKGELRRGRSCFVLESINPNARPGEYSRVVSWIDKESGAPIEAEAYGIDGRLLKDFEIGSVRKVNGRYQVKDLKMSNRRDGTRTTLEFDPEPR
jgi:Outer membrane lipoprotein-sorting protein